MSALVQTYSITGPGTVVTGPLLNGLDVSGRSLLLQAVFSYGSGGTTVDAYVQSSVDGGVTWYDIANFHFTTANKSSAFNVTVRTPVTTPITPGDGALSVDSAVDGIVGDQLRLKIVTAGTYSATTLSLSAVVH